MRYYTLRLLSISIGMALGLFISGCSTKTRADRGSTEGRWHSYAKRAYIEQEAERVEVNPSRAFTEPGHEELIYTFNDQIEPVDWQRYPYETVENWMDRIHKRLMDNHNAIRGLEQNLETHEKEEQAYLGDIQKFIQQNQQLKGLIDQQVASNTETQTKSDSYLPAAVSAGLELPAPPFRVHYVKKGETLFSIAMHYYKNRDMVEKILLWNQEWIRHPNEIIAGISLVLFPIDAESTGQQVVDAYLDKLDVYE
jgi:hypothetical protein